jgi:hypothetical protein
MRITIKAGSRQVIGPVYRKKQEEIAEDQRSISRMPSCTLPYI